MISSLLSRASAALLFVGGIALLFASDVLLPRIAPGMPPATTWLGQLLGAAWLAVASLNWLQRATIMGGIYGRPLILTNLALFGVSALSVLRVLLAGGAPRALWVALAAAALFAAAYATLLLRGPFDELQGNAR